jgi:hypothetical protein
LLEGLTTANEFAARLAGLPEEIEVRTYRICSIGGEMLYRNISHRQLVWYERQFAKFMCYTLK